MTRHYISNWVLPIKSHLFVHIEYTVHTLLAISNWSELIIRPNTDNQLSLMEDIIMFTVVKYNLHVIHLEQVNVKHSFVLQIMVKYSKIIYIYMWFVFQYFSKSNNKTFPILSVHLIGIHISIARSASIVVNIINLMSLIVAILV